MNPTPIKVFFPIPSPLTRFETLVSKKRPLRNDPSLNGQRQFILHPDAPLLTLATSKVLIGYINNGRNMPRVKSQQLACQPLSLLPLQTIREF
jgi:hypothetical protein